MKLHIVAHDIKLEPLFEAILIVRYGLLHIVLAQRISLVEKLENPPFVVVLVDGDFPPPSFYGLVQHALDVKSLSVAFYFLDRWFGHQKEHIFLVPLQKYFGGFLQMGHFLEEEADVKLFLALAPALVELFHHLPLQECIEFC